jgi:Calx-beta domain-containing protein
MPRTTPMALFACLVFLSLAPATVWSANTYTWQGGTPGEVFTDPNSWSPVRSSPRTDDILVFPAVANALVNGVPNQTVAQVIFVAGGVYQFSTASSLVTLNIAGDAGLDFDVPSGTVLTVTGTNVVQISLAPGATGRIAGEFHVDGAAHRLLAWDAGALVIADGGKVITQGTFSGNLFGVTNLNSVVFENGSTYEEGAGANPFGASQPNSVVVFQHGSLLRLVANITPAMSGRTYANFEYDTPGTLTATGTSPMSIDSIKVKQGNFSLALAAPVSIKGSIWVGLFAKLKLGPLSGTATYTFNGSATQDIFLDLYNQPPSSNSFDGQPGTTLAIDNPAGVRLTDGAAWLNCSIQFIHGSLICPYWGGDRLYLNTQAQLIGASPTTGWVNGTLCKYLTALAPTFTFPVGDDLTYDPVTLDYHGLNTDLLLLVSTSVPEGVNYFPFFTMSQIDTTKKVNRVWYVEDWPSGAGKYTNFDATVNWSASDVDPGADPSQFVYRAFPWYYNGINTEWTQGPALDIPTGARTATSVQGLGLTRDPGNGIVHYIVVGQPATVGINAEPAAVAEGAAGAPRTKATSGGTLTFPVSILPASVSTATVDYSVVDGTATSASGDYTPVSGTLTFAPGDTVKYVDVPIVGDATPERNETVQLELANPSGAVIATGTSAGTLLDDDDVTPPTVAVTSPNGGEIDHVGAPVDLQWNANDDVFVSAVDLEISRDGGATYETVASGVPNTGTYTWTSTGPVSAAMLLRVTAKDDPGHSAVDVSDALWTLDETVAADPVAPRTFALSPVAPNPARGTLGIRYALPRAAHVQLDIVDVRGRIVTTLVRGEQPAGQRSAAWATKSVASGLYFARFRAPGFEAVQRFVVMR